MTDEPVIFNGEELPPLRRGKVWGFRIYPGGRKEVKQCMAERLQTPNEAVRRLKGGSHADVWLDDAVFALILWNQAKEADHV